MLAQKAIARTVALPACTSTVPAIARHYSHNNNAVLGMTGTVPENSFQEVTRLTGSRPHWTAAVMLQLHLATRCACNDDT